MNTNISNTSAAATTTAAAATTITIKKKKKPVWSTLVGAGPAPTLAPVSSAASSSAVSSASSTPQLPRKSTVTQQQPPPPPPSVPQVASFDDMGLPEALLRGVYGYGFETPSVIQQQAIVPIMSGRDVLGQAQSGTGKTGAFVTGVLGRVVPSLHRVQVLILTPVRELALQTYDVVLNLSQHMGIRVALCVAGTSRNESKDELRRGPQVVVGTPGRVLDLLKDASGAFDVSALKSFVMDEADEMMTRGLGDQVRDIFSLLPSEAGNLQCVVMSATFPPEALRVADRFLVDPLRIRMTDAELNLAGIMQFYTQVSHDKKLGALMDISSAIPVAKMIIFVNTRKAAEWLSEQLDKADFSVATVHADLTKEERATAVSRFRSDRARVLVSTDLLGRGLDVQQVSLVINFDITSSREGYVHRIGRCGRKGRKGVVINLVAPDEERDIICLRDKYGYAVTELQQDFPKYFA